MAASYSYLFSWFTVPENLPASLLIQSSSPIPIPSPGEQATVPGSRHIPPEPGEDTVVLTISSRSYGYTVDADGDASVFVTLSDDSPG